MKLGDLPQRLSAVLLQDAARRELTTARRTRLSRILYHERYLTREQLIVRVEWLLGKDCFGKQAWKDSFYRDMHVVKRAFKAQGYDLKYSRKTGAEGYYLAGEPRISETLRRIIAGAAAEIDPKQMEVIHKLSLAERFEIGCSMSDAARDAKAYRLRLKNPELSETEALRLSLVLDRQDG